MIFTDTSAFFALADTSDEFHREAQRLLSVLLSQQEPLVTHNYVIVETAALLHARLGQAAARAFLTDVGRTWKILWIAERDHQRAIAVYSAQRGSKLSFVDCVSFELMRRHTIRRCFAFDDDFARQGFERVQAPPHST